ncbi:MBG domain-containing protein [uncultured Polaribacter sp.]|uniref:MBG domain-containing protein n=1 Tax=uncultured Polaribacter sp. TaxID=174711 RepID=UPI0026030032|nr:MBG domain-containing protein [uncultured Polaribacter sp.]
MHNGLNNIKMKFFNILFCLSLTFITFNSFSQEIVDLSTWEQRGDLNNGNWVYDSNANSVKQTTNSNPTFYVSDQNFINKTITGEIYVNTSSDDDFIGFVLGFEEPTASLLNRYKFLLVDWKQLDQDPSNNTLAKAEIRLIYYDKAANDPGNIFWSTPTQTSTWGVIDTYDPSPSFPDVNSQGGWEEFKTIEFKTVYSENNVKIFFDFGDGNFTKVFDVDASSVPFFESFPEGRVGFYNYSQNEVIYKNFTVPNGNFEIVSTGGGIEGVDWMLSGSTLIPLSSNAKINSSDFESLQTGVSTIKISAESAFTLSDEIDITIPLTIESETITLNSDIISSVDIGEALALKSEKSISTNTSGVTIITQGGNVLLNSNTDDSEGGSIAMDIATINTNGGNITLSGGSDPFTGYAEGLNEPSITGYSLQTPFKGIFLNGTTLNAAGGDIILRGKGGDVTGVAGSYFAIGIDMVGYQSDAQGNANTLGTIITTSGSGSISLNGLGGVNNNANTHAVGINFFENNGGVNSIITTDGSISLHGSDGSGNAIEHVGVLNDGGDVSIYSNSGSIKISGAGDTAAYGFKVDGPTNIGWDGANAFTSGDIAIDVDNFSFTSLANFKTAGGLSFQPYGNSFVSGGISFPTSNGTLANTISSLTIGKSTNTADVTISAAISMAGPITVYGGNININQNLSSTANGAPILFKASGSITVASDKSIQTNNGDIIYWADSDIDNEGAISLGDNVTLNSANGSTTSNLSGGGKIVLAGGADDGANDGTASDGIPDGFASSSTGNGIKLSASTENHTQMYSGGGNIIIRGLSNHDSPSDNRDEIGIQHQGSWTANSGNGSIDIIGISDKFYGVNFVRVLSYSITGPKLLSLISNKAVGAAITISGTSSTSHGVVFNYDNPKEILATGGGDIVITGAGAGSGYGIFLQNQDILATTGAIILNAGAKGIYTANAGMNLGRKVGSPITISSSDIRLIADRLEFVNTANLSTSGKVTIESNADSFTGVLTFPVDNLTLSNDVSGLTLGKATNTVDITVSNATTIAGPITIYGSDLTFNAALTATDDNINLHATGNVTQSAALTANGLGLHGTGTFTLTNTSNNVATIAGGDNTTKLGSLSFVDATGGLTIGTVNPTGIAATGDVLIETLSGDILLKEPIFTTSSTTTAAGYTGAIVLNAGKNSAIGTTTGGDIIVSDDGAVSAPNGITKLYSGKESTSTGLTTLAGGTANNRNSVDETTTTFSPVLNATGGNNYALYREAGNNSLYTDGSNDFVQLASSPIADGATDFTIELWIKPDASNFDDTEYHGFIGYYTGITNTRSPSLWLKEGKVHLDSYRNSDKQRFDFLTDRALITQDEWTHVAFVKDAEIFRVYLDGELAITTVAPDQVNIEGDSYYIGRVNNYFSGQLDEVRFWNDARTEAEILDLMNVEATGTETGLVAYYDFNHGVPGGTNAGLTTLEDRTIGVNDGILNNAALSGSSSNWVSGFFPKISGEGFVYKGETSQLIHFASGGTWSVDNPSIGTITSGGLLTGVTSGQVVVTYTQGGNTSSKTIDVVDPNNLGGLTVVTSGGTAAGNGWTYSNGVIRPTSSNAVNVNASDVLAKLNLNHLTIEASTITINADVLSSYSNDLTLKATGNITVNEDHTIQTNGGDIILWSNNDDETINGGYIYLQDNTTIDTRTSSDRTSANGSNDDENGGAIILGGGTGTTVPAGYALNNANTLRGGISLGTESGGQRHDSNITLISGGGDISLKGKQTSLLNGDAAGINAYEGFVLDAGKTGNITLEGDVSDSNASYSDGMNLGNYATTAGGAASHIKTVDGDIALMGSASDASVHSRGLTLAGGGAGLFIQSTGTGSISLSGTPGGTGVQYNILLIGANILASSGDIDLVGGSTGKIFNTSFASTIGYKLGSDVLSSTSDITVTGDDFDLSSGFNFNTAGTLKVESFGNSFTNAFNTSQLTYSSDLTGLTIGKSTNTSNVTVASDIDINGPVSIYGGNIYVNENIDTQGGATNGDVLLKVSADIVLAESKTITTDGGDVILWSNSDNETTSGSLITRKGSSITTNSGHLWIGGGAESGSLWNGLTVGDGYAVAGTSLNDLDRPNTNTDASWRGAGIFLDGTTINTSGGHIAMYGKSVGNYDGLVTYGINTINSGTGKISINADANDNYASLFGVHNSVTPSITNITSTNSDADAITFNLGSGTGTQNYGAWVEGDVIVLAANGGGITYNALSNVSNVGLNLGYSTTSSGYLYLLADVGDINLNTGLGGITLQNQFTDIYLGKNADKGVSSSSSDITFTSDKISSNGILHFSTSGAITIESLGNSFTSAFDTSTLDYSSDVTGLIIGKATNNQDVTIGAVVIDGPLTVYGKNIAVSGAVNVGNNTVKLSGSGNVTDGVNGYIIAESLALLDGNVTLDNTSNNVSSIAGGDNATKLGSLNYINSVSLTVGSVNPTGITSSGTIELATLTGDLTITEPIVSTKSTGDAVKLYADKDATAGNAGDGNIKITDNGSITVESGARALLYSGKESESTGVQTEVGGESNTRTSVDATTDLSTVDPVLSATGKYGLFRMKNVNDNANLVSLTTSSGALSPVFASATTDYTVVLPQGTTSVNFTPTTDDGSATLKINETAHTSGVAYTASNLKAYQLYEIEVTASDGVAKKTYKLAVLVTQATVPSPTGVWRNLFAGENFDPNDDQQATADTDLVGNSTDAMMQAQQETYSFSDGQDKVYYFRVRLGNENAPNTSFYYGMDVDSDYKIDFVIEANLKDKTPYVAYHAHDPSKDGSGPSQTAWLNSKKDNNIERQLGARDARIVSYVTQGESTTNVDIDGPVGGQNNGDDTWLEFAFTESSFKSWTNDYLGNELTGSDVNGLVAFTSTSQTANGDIGGINDKTADLSLTWQELGNFIESNLDDVTTYSLFTPTVASQLSRTTTPTVTGSWGGSNEGDDTLTVTIDGVTYTVGNGLTTDGSSWSVEVSTPLAEGIYDVTATASRASDGSSKTDSTAEELEVKLTILLTSETITVASISDLVYTGSGQTPSPEVKDGTTALVQDTDYTLSYQDNINVGEATVTITGINAYEGSRTVTFNITPAPLTIVAEDKSKVFGEVDPELTVSYAGFVNGEDKDDLTGTLSISRVSGEAVSTYAITASGLTSTNYDITYTPGTFAITSRLITQSAITVLPITDLVYTGSVQIPSPEVKDGATVLVEDTDYTLSYQDNINVGTATVTVTGTGNYNGTKDVTFAITPAPLTITAEDKSKVFGEVDPSLTVSYTGFVNAEDQEDLTGALSISRVSGEAVSTYAITASGLTSTNYDITYTPGTFAITSRLISQSAITVSSITDLVYTGLGQTPSPEVKDGAITLVQDTDYTLSYQDNLNVGQATVTVTGKGNYNGTRTVTFNILKKTLTISGLSADDKEYDGTTEATLSGTASLVGLVDGDDVVLSGTPESTFTSPNVSTAITVTVVGYELTGAAKDNYSLSQPTGLSADITYRVISVIPTNGLTKQYGEVDPEFTYTFSGSISGQMAAFRGSLSREQGEDVDSYQITQGSLSLIDNGNFKASNYTITLTTNIDFEITKAPLIVTVNNDAKFVTQADRQGYAGVSYSGFKFGEDLTSLNTTNLTITRSNSGVEAAGIYTDVLEASGITSQNYSISYEPADYQIVAADQLYVKLADTEVVYGEDPVYRVELSGYYSSDNTQVVDLTSSTSVTGNKVTVVDGVSGSAEFLIVPETPLYSTSNHLSVGAYNLVSDQAVFTSSNFNNTLIEQGVLRVNPKELVVSLSSTKSKVYDGNALLPSMIFDLSTPFTGDKVSALGTGIYESANAGETDYRVSGLSLSGSDANNYYIQGGANTQITGTDGQISKRTISVVPRVGQSKIFGTSDPILTYDYNGEVNGETPVFNGSLEREVGESRGLYAISQGSLLLTDKDSFIASNYELAFTSGIDFTITNKLLSDQDINILPISEVIYNGQAQEPTPVVKDGGVTLTEGVDYELSYDNNTDVGKATITITGLGNYGGVRTVTFNILPRVITVTPDSDQSKEYGESDPLLTYTFSGEVSGETPDFDNTLSRELGEDVDSYQITQGSLTLADNGLFKASNYEIDFTANIDFTISKASLTITVNNDSKFVTQADVAGYAGVSYSGFKFGEDQTAIDTTNLSITRSNLGVEAVGIYPSVLEASGVISQNYDIVYQKGDYTIIGADQLLVKLKDSEVVYADVPVFEVLEAGYYNSSNELIEDLTSSVQVIGTEVTVTDGTSGTAVFDIVVVSPQLSSSGTLQSGSYVLESGNISKTSPNFSDTIILQGNLNVTPKELTVSLISSVIKEYDGNDNLLNLELSLTTPIDTDIVLASGAGVYESKDVGVRNYTVSGITLSGADAGNYFIQGGVNASITGTDGEITKRVLTVTPDANQGKTFGESDPSLTYSYSGLINGEIPLFSGTLGRDQGEAVGSYQITQGSLVSQDNGVFLKGNYELVFTEGEFTITAKSITDADISVAPIEDFVYTGQGITPPLTVKDGATTLVQGTDYGLDYSNNINVGIATVTIVSYGNYTGNKVVTFNITRAPLTITAEDKTKEFGEDDPELTVSYTGFVNGEDAEDLTGSLAISRATGESAGTYAITASGLTSTNYALTYTEGDFTITSKSITDTDITVSPITDLVYNGSLQRPKPMVEDDSNLLDEGIDYRLSYSDNTNVGQARVTITGIGNYNGSRTVRFMILPKVIEILIPDQEKDYGAQDPVLVFTADPVLFGSDEFTGVLSRESGEAVGEYLISSGTLSAGDNYTLNIQSDAIFRIIRIDSDGDGVADDIEETDGTDPLDTCDFVLASQTFPPSIAWDTADCDIDGVTNAEELIDGTDPLNSDSDGDGVVDGYEKTDGTDPLDFCSSVPSRITESLSDEFLFSDCDGDGLSNGDEIGLDPKNPIDSNGNGVFDYLEFNNYRPSAEDNLEIFNLLTPNGDGQNDVFVIRNIELYPENILEIYNRWGSKVYNVSGYGQNGNYFTGVSNGRGVISPSSLLPTGTYFYILKYKSSSGDFKERKGYLYLTR